MSQITEENERLARAWLTTFNERDVKGLLALYDDDCIHSSPKIRALHPQTGGQLEGKEALAQWWGDALKRLPGLRYEEVAITANESRVLLEYLRHVPDEPALPVAEVFNVRAGKIVSSRVYHG